MSASRLTNLNDRKLRLSCVNINGLLLPILLHASQSNAQVLFVSVVGSILRSLELVEQSKTVKSDDESRHVMA